MFLVLFNGSNLSALTLAYLADNNKHIETAWYLDIENAVKSAYNLGVVDGKANASVNNVNITYTVKHTHNSSCYPTAAFTYLGSEYNKYIESTEYIWVCSVCNKQFVDRNSDGWTARQTFNAHLVSGHCPNSSFRCGKIEGTRTTTNISTLASGDAVISATITY